MDLHDRASTPVSIDRSRRSNHSAPLNIQTTTLNEKLNTDYIDLGGVDADGIQAQTTKAIAGWVGDVITPRQLLIVLRILKAVTFCFLLLTVVADLMYIIFLEVLATRDVRDIVGGRRDLIIRVYGLLLAGVAIAIEVDVAWVVKAFYGFKGFVARAALLFFVANITGAHPLQQDQLQQNKAYAEWVSNQGSNNNNQYDDGASANDDGAVAMDDGTVVYDDLYYIETNTVPDIPDSVIVFQMVTSFILGACAITYFVFGLLCLDRFTSKAYLSSQDPLVSTAIPTPKAHSAHEPSSDDNYRTTGSFVPPNSDA